MGPLWGGVGKIFLAQNESRIYPNMCAKFGCGPTVVSKKRGETDRQTDRQRKLQLYIVDNPFNLPYHNVCIQRIFTHQFLVLHFVTCGDHSHGSIV